MTTGRQRGRPPLQRPRGPVTPRVVFALSLLALGLLGDDCFGGKIIRPPDPANSCVALQSAFPPGLAFVPGATSTRLWVMDLSPATVVPFEVEVVPPQMADPPPPDPVAMPGTLALQDLVIQAVGLVASSSPDQVVFFSLATGDLLDVTVDDALRVTLPTNLCVELPADSVDSEGEVIDKLCDEQIGFLSAGTSGVAIAQGKLFVSVSNPVNVGVFHPGAVLVFDIGLINLVITITFDRVILTHGYNPTHVDSVTVNGESFILVTMGGVSPSSDAEPVDDPSDLDGSIEVIDVETLETIAKYPLPSFPSGGGLAIDSAAQSQIAVAGSHTERELHAVDLQELSSVPLGEFTDLVDSVSSQLTPRRANGANQEDCPPLAPAIGGVAFSDDGGRVFATDFCDGSVVEVSMTPGAPPAFSGAKQTPFVTPYGTEDAEAPRGLGAIAIRPGDPTLYTGPDVFVLVGEPEGMLCAISIDAS